MDAKSRRTARARTLRRATRRFRERRRIRLGSATRSRTASRSRSGPAEDAEEELHKLRDEIRRLTREFKTANADKAYALIPEILLLTKQADALEAVLH